MRRAYLDSAPGERRGVVTLDGRPERLLIEREADAPQTRLGARVAARVRAWEKGLRIGFLDLGGDAEAVVSGGTPLVEGAPVVVEITAEARVGKVAVARVLGPADGAAPRLLQPAPSIEARLTAWAGETPRTGLQAEAAADEAEAEAEATEHPLPGGGWLYVERTRALTAVDVDAGSGTGGGGRGLAGLNRRAVDAAARLLRLKGLGGLVVVDLAGGQAEEALLAHARAAFAPDNPGVVFGPLSRLGLLQLAKPWRETPVEERLRDAAGRPRPETAAARLIRTLRREGRSDPGGLWEAVCAPEVAAVAAPRAAALGPRYAVRAALGADPERPEIRRR